MNQISSPKYKIGDYVFHITPESDQGVIIDINYSYLTHLHQYRVSFSSEIESLWYYEHELSKNRVYKIENN